MPSLSDESILMHGPLILGPPGWGCSWVGDSIPTVWCESLELVCRGWLVAPLGLIELFPVIFTSRRTRLKSVRVAETVILELPAWKLSYHCQHSLNTGNIFLNDQLTCSWSHLLYAGQGFQKPYQLKSHGDILRNQDLSVDINLDETVDIWYDNSCDDLLIKHPNSHKGGRHIMRCPAHVSATNDSTYTHEKLGREKHLCPGWKNLTRGIQS